MFRLVYNFLFRTKRRSLTVRALLLSAVARLRVHIMPSEKLHRYFGQRGEESSFAALSPDEQLAAYWIASKVKRVAGRTPWESKCLVRAMVAQRLLKSCGLSSTLYLGVGRDEKSAMVAHAWVRCGTLYITGGNGKGYATVAFFSMHPRPRSVREDG